MKYLEILNAKVNQGLDKMTGSFGHFAKCLITQLVCNICFTLHPISLSLKNNLADTLKSCKRIIVF